MKARKRAAKAIPQKRGSSDRILERSLALLSHTLAECARAERDLSADPRIALLVEMIRAALEDVEGYRPPMLNRCVAQLLQLDRGYAPVAGGDTSWQDLIDGLRPPTVTATRLVGPILLKDWHNWTKGAS